MKALTFLQAYSQIPPYENSSESILRRVAFNLREYYDFVSQPFRPEMIVELFEGWYIEIIEENFFVNDSLGAIGFEEINTTISFEEKNNTMLFYPKSKEVYSNILIFNAPTTLNDFISDCQRAGIELTFKEEVVNKFIN